MSTTMYFNIEVTSIKNYPRLRWWHFAKVDLSNDYLLFALLSGVRREDITDNDLEFQVPKGLPDDVSEYSLEADSLAIDDDGARLEVPDVCSREAAERWVEDGLSRYLHDGYTVTHPDCFGHSWAPVRELELILRRYQIAGGDDTDTLSAVIAMMNRLEVDGNLTRAVFWFI